MKNKIRLQFLGAAGYVTGSRTLLETPLNKHSKSTKIFIDAGIYQGLKYIEQKNYDVLNENFETIDAVILTHAHIDHSGLLPLLIKNGFKGKIFCTHSTFEILKIVLPDSGRIQEEEYKFLSKKKKNKLPIDSPLYTEADAVKVFSFVESVSFDQIIKIKDIEFKYIWAGHILGAASVYIKYKNKTFLFSGDIGALQPIFHKQKDTPVFAENIILESTYGDVRFSKTEEYKENYEEIIQKSVQEIIQKRGMLIIPSFAVGRSQLILYVIFRMMTEKKIPNLPVYLDSPMSIKATMAYSMFPEEMNQEVIHSNFFQMIKNVLATKHNNFKLEENFDGCINPSNKINLTEYKNLFFIDKIIDSIRLNKVQGPGILISAGGMCQGGRILHHLYNRIYDRRNTILFIGYQAEGTLGRNIVMGDQRVTIFGKELPVRAQLKSIHSFTAHADQDALLEWIKSIPSNEKIKNIFIQHGEDFAREELKKAIEERILSLEHTTIEIPKNESIYYF